MAGDRSDGASAGPGGCRPLMHGAQVRLHREGGPAARRASMEQAYPAGVPADTGRGPRMMQGPFCQAAHIKAEGGGADALPSLPGTNALCWPAASCSPTDSLRSTIGARGLNFWVRNGTRCASPAMAAGRHRAFMCPSVPWGPHSARQPSQSILTLRASEMKSSAD